MKVQNTQLPVIETKNNEKKSYNLITPSKIPWI